MTQVTQMYGRGWSSLIVLYKKAPLYGELSNEVRLRGWRYKKRERQRVPLQAYSAYTYFIMSMVPMSGRRFISPLQTLTRAIIQRTTWNTQMSMPITMPAVMLATTLRSSRSSA